MIDPSHQLYIPAPAAAEPLACCWQVGRREWPNGPVQYILLEFVDRVTERAARKTAAELRDEGHPDWAPYPWLEFQVALPL